MEQSQEQLKTFDSKIEENAQKPEYAKKVARYQTQRGVKTVTAMTIVAEVGDMRRYGTAPQFMASTGLVSSEHSTGEHEHRGKITKAGNAHLRRVLVEGGWHYRHRGSAGKAIKKRPGYQERFPSWYCVSRRSAINTRCRLARFAWLSRRRYYEFGRAPSPAQYRFPSAVSASVFDPLPLAVSLTRRS